MGGMFKKPKKANTKKFIERPGAALQKDMPDYTQAAKKATAARLEEIERVMPGATAQRAKAVSRIEDEYKKLEPIERIAASRMRGEIPQDVQQQTMRNIAEYGGAGFNPATAGRAGGFQVAQGMVPRQFGLTSLDLQNQGTQLALQRQQAATNLQSTAMGWQQLADAFAYDPFEAAGAAGPSQRYGEARAGAEQRDVAAYNQQLANQQKNIMGAVTGLAAIAAPIAAPAILGGLAGGAASLGLGTTATTSALAAGGAGTGLAGSFQNMALGSFGMGGGAPGLAALQSIYGK
jgi:hypothetical protein